MYRDILEERVLNEKRAFDKIKKNLWIAQNKNLNRRRRSSSGKRIIVIKREVNETILNPSGLAPCNLTAVEKETLFEAARTNDLAKVKSFIEEHNAAISVTNDARQTLAHVAAKSGSLDVLKYVASRLPSILTKTDKHDYTALRHAVRVGALSVVKYLVENHEEDLTRRNDRDFRSTSMHTAIKFGHLDILKYLIDDRHFDMERVGELINQPPIFTALQYRQGDIVQYLMYNKSVDLQKLDSIQENILYVAVRIDDLSAMKYLLDERKLNFDINWRNLFGETLVFRAASFNRTDILKYLVEEKLADVNIACKWDNQSPLHCAACIDNAKMCKYLIEHRAKPDMKNKYGQLPADVATDAGLKSYLKSASILKEKFLVTEKVPK